MIIDTTYLLPAARIEVKADLLLAIARKAIPPSVLMFEDITISSISIFELQAKAAKLRVKPDYVLSAIAEFTKVFKIEPYYSPGIIKTASILRDTLLSDYINCIIVATAIELNEKLVSEDSKTIRNRQTLKEKYGLQLLNYTELLSASKEAG